MFCFCSYFFVVAFDVLLLRIIKAFTFFRAIKPNFLHSLPDNLLVVHFSPSCNLTKNHDHSCLCCSLCVHRINKLEVVVSYKLVRVVIWFKRLNFCSKLNSRISILLSSRTKYIMSNIVRTNIFSTSLKSIILDLSQHKLPCMFHCRLLCMFTSIRTTTTHREGKRKGSYRIYGSQ